MVDFSFLLSGRQTIIFCFLSADVKFACSVQASSFGITKVSKLLGLVNRTEFSQCSSTKPRFKAIFILAIPVSRS